VLNEPLLGGGVMGVAWLPSMICSSSSVGACSVDGMQEAQQPLVAAHVLGLADGPRPPGEQVGGAVVDVVGGHCPSNWVNPRGRDHGAALAGS
jgi:hypothetical protein